MTEAEAKTKWCPLARVLSTVGNFNIRNDGKRPDATRCVGSECMAWRWAVLSSKHYHPSGEKNPETGERYYTGETPGQGYCGAFGQDLGQ